MYKLNREEWAFVVVVVVASLLWASAILSVPQQPPWPEYVIRNKEGQSYPWRDRLPYLVNAEPDTRSLPDPNK